ncbi:hypothetical protein PN499_05565 [Kamptonema animale CS-326]|nr:hypothetical protein [Kamptonema animale]MDB9510644.1 hypothetical protein [Kamptonema animale CS-326]
MRQLSKPKSSICGSGFGSVAFLAAIALVQSLAHCSVHSSG